MIVIHLFTIILSGWLAWTWVQPESFGGAILFLMIRSALESAFAYLISIIAVLLFDREDGDNKKNET